MSRRLVAVVLALVMLAGVTSCSLERRLGAGELDQRTEGAFYVAPTPTPEGDPGSLVRSEPIRSAPDGTKAWRIMYHSRDLRGADVLVTGVVVAPEQAPAAGERTVVSWAHPTTGVAARCAPSVGIDPFILIEGLHRLITAGYVVVATDYPGMGLEGPNSYLIGRTAGNSVLDAARAAREVPDAHAGDELLLWGHSQGGQAVLFAAQDAESYAPDLRLVAAAVAAPAADLGSLLQDDIGDISGVTIGSYAFDSLVKTYGADDPRVTLDGLLTPAGAAAVPEMVGLCLLGQNSELHTIAKPLIGAFVKVDPATTQPWASLLEENTPGTTPITVPLLVAQGESDTLVRPATTDAFVQHECDIGTRVDYVRITDTGHGEVALRALDTLLPFFGDAVAGRSPASTC